MSTASPATLKELERSEEATPEARRAVWGAFAGFFVDNFDIFLPVIALAPALIYFIPEHLSPTTKAIVAAMIFATTLIGRPLGAIIFGHFADTVGRKKITIISVLGFAVVTLIIAALPGHEHIGDAVLWIFILLRLVDGIFLGGQYTAASPLAMEYSPKAKRGFYGALIQSAASFGTAAISLVTLAVLYFLPAGKYDSPYVQWGWRIPFLVGAVMAFAMAYYYHTSVEESRLWKTAKKSKATESPLKTLFRGNNLKSFLQVFVVMTGFWLSLNAALAIMPGLLIKRLHVTGTHLTVTLVIAYVVLGFSYIMGGIISQRIGRKRYLMISSLVAGFVGTYFYYQLLGAQPGDGFTIGLLATITTVLVVSPGALGTVYINERFQTGVRASGFGLGYSLAIILPAFYVFYQAGLASFMPFDYTVLVIGAVGALLIFIGAAIGPETKDVDFAGHARVESATAKERVA